MPKGALLHAHLEATVDASMLLKLGLEHDNMCIRALEPITSANLSRLLPQFGAQPVAGEREYTKGPTITDVDYVSESWISARRAREEWPAAMGGPGGFDRWVVRSMVINPEEAYGTQNTTRKIWMKFVSAFSVIYVSLCRPEKNEVGYNSRFSGDHHVRTGTCSVRAMLVRIMCGGWHPVR